MGSSSYEIMGRRGDELHDDFTDKGRGAGVGEGLDHHGGDSRPQEYWTSSCSTLEATKPLRVKLNAREVTYGDLTAPILIPRGGRVISEGSKSWPILVDHSKENGSGFDDQDHMSPIALQGRNNDVQVPGANGMIQDRGTARGGGGGDKIPKAAGDSEIEDMGAGGNTGDDDRWNPTAMGEDRGSIQQGEAGDDQVDWSIHKRQRAGRLKGPAEHWDLYTGEREPGQEDHRWEPITTATTNTVGGKNGKGSLAWPVNGGGGGGGHATYGECQKNQCADRGTTSLDGCGEFMPAGKEGKNALACAACGCHRNFHRRIMLSGEEEEDEREEKREKEEGGGINYHHSSLCSIEHVAHELMAAASRAIPSISQDFQLGHPKGHSNCVRDLSLKERKTMAKIFIENLDHIAKMMFSTAECLAMLQKPSNSRQTASSRERERENKYNHAGGASPLRTTAATSYEGPLSSDVSPVSTVEKRAVSLPPPLSLQQPWDDGAAAGGPLKLNGGSCGTQLHNSIAISRKVADRRLGNHKSKRTRTCISMEQREKLNTFAERAGWTVVGQRKETIEAACQDIGESPPSPLNATFPCMFIHRLKGKMHIMLELFWGQDCPLLTTGQR